MAIYSDLPTISTAWSENTAPLNQTREQTREDIRRMLSIPVTLQGLGDLTTNMNSTAELSPATVTGLEASLVEYKALETQKVNLETASPWDGAAPLKKADVVEYDTSLLASGNSITIQTQGVTQRMAEIESEFRTALGYGQQGFARLYRS